MDGADLGWTKMDLDDLRAIEGGATVEEAAEALCYRTDDVACK